MSTTLRRFRLDDRAGNVAVLHREGAAEAATYVAVIQLDQCQAFNAGQELARLVADSELAQSGAGIVIRHGAIEGCVHACDTKHVDEEAGQLVGSRREFTGARQPVRVVSEEFRVMRLDHSSARAGWRHHIIVTAELRDRTFGDSRVVERSPEL